MHIRHDPKEKGKLENISLRDTPNQSNMTIEEMRTYLTCIRSLRIELGEEIIARAEKDYLESRSTSNSETEMETNIDDLHRWLTLARLVTATYGEDQVRLRPHWTRTKALKTVRKRREAQYKKERLLQNQMKLNGKESIIDGSNFMHTAPKETQDSKNQIEILPASTEITDDVTKSTRTN